MDQRVALPDGRTLAYRTYGAAGGAVVVNCHGGLLCGTDVAYLDTAAADLGLRIVSPDRPGIGASSPAPGRNTADFADDVRALLHALDVERASVLGWSMGGQYALGCAARCAERIDRVVVIAGAVPLDASTVGELNAMDRRLTHLSQRRAPVARATFAMLGVLARRAPKLWTRQLVKDISAQEADAVRALPDPGFAASAAIALAHGRGMVEEYRAWARPWGFALEDVAVPTVVWQGEADALVPAAWGKRISSRIPGARLDLRAGEGHFLGLRHPVEILRDLLP